MAFEKTIRPQVAVMHSKIYADYTASITELKHNPQSLINDAKGEPIALLNHNRATAYIVPAETYRGRHR